MNLRQSSGWMDDTDFERKRQRGIVADTFSADNLKISVSGNSVPSRILAWSVSAEPRPIVNYLC
jgi:hypothetical protein